MGYAHIENLYKSMEILQTEKEIYTLEKVHGTSANIQFVQSVTSLKIIHFHGGGNRDEFISSHDIETLENKYYRFFNGEVVSITGYNIIFFGELYGGKIHRMKHTYGESQKFIVFDVFCGTAKYDGKDREGYFLPVPQAEMVAREFGFDFVSYKKIECNLDLINAERDAPSAIAHALNLGDQIREGVVLRPTIEKLDRFGNRLIVKHKRNEFMETKTPREISPEKLKAMEDAKAVAEEWVTEMRLEHVLDALAAKGVEIKIENMCHFIAAMVEDVYREGKGELIESENTTKMIGKHTALLFKKRLESSLK